MAKRIDDLAHALGPYLELLRGFVAGTLRAQDFSREFAIRYLADNAPLSREIFDVLDHFFAEVEALISDPAAGQSAYRGIGPEELRERARELLRRAGYQD